MRALGADPKSDRFPPVTLPPPTDSAPDTQDAAAHATQSTSQDSGAEAALGGRLYERFLTAKNDESLVLRISVHGYFPIFQPGTAEGFFEDLKQREGGLEGVKEAQVCRVYREEVMKDGFLMNNAGMKGLSKEEVEKRNEEFSVLAKGKERKVEAIGDGEGEKMEVDA